MMARQMVNFVYLIGDRETGEAVAVDPAYAVQDLLDILAADGMQLTGVLGTHFHPDHLGGQMGGWSLEGISTLLEKVQVPIHVQAEEVPWVERTTGVGGADLVAHHSGDALQVGQRARRDDPHARAHAGKPVLPGRRPARGRRHALPRGLRADGLPGLGPAGHVRVHPHPSGPCPRRGDPVPRPPLLAGSLAEHGRNAAVELRLPATLRPGVDGDVRLMSPSGEFTADSTVLVVGASLAGWRAVETLRAEGFDGSISLIGEEPHLPYDRPPLSKQVLAGTWPPEKAVLADKRRSSEHRVHEVLGRRAVRLDAETRKVELNDGTVMQGDAIVIATGARPRPLPGTEELGQRDGLFTLRTLDDSLALRAAVTAVEAARVVVIGAGFIGAEVASTCAGLGCRVTVLEALDVPLRNVLGPTIGSHFASLHESHGVDLRTGVGVRSVGRAGGSARQLHPGPGAGRLVVELDGGETFPADVVVVGIGVIPATDWLADSGLTIDNGVVCDDRLFAADGIVAAGDIARWHWRRDGGEEQIRIEHWQVAAEAGVAAARSLLAGRADAPAFTPVPYFWSDQYGIRLQVLGEPARERRHPHRRRIARGGEVRRALRQERPPACGHGHRQAPAADGIPAAPAGGQQLGRRAGPRRVVTAGARLRRVHARIGEGTTGPERGRK